LLFVLLREKGLHIWDGFPCFMTNAYVAEDIAQIKTVLLSSINELVVAGFLKTQTLSPASKTEDKQIKSSIDSLNTPPIEGAKLGKDEHGNPAWFVKDEQKNGGYHKIDL